MKNWFTNYPGQWNAARARANFTNDDPEYSFVPVIRTIRDWFFLEKTRKVGNEIGRGIPRIYKDMGIQVYVDQFVWGNFVQVDGEWQPLLQLKMRVSKTSGRSQKLILNDWVEIRFDPRWPFKPPHVRINNERYKNFDGNAHANHMYSNGWVCFFAGAGDWVRGTDTVISFIQAFFDWFVWHYDKFGW